MKGEWVMFRLKPRPGERQEPWMLKKVDDEFAKPEEGEALVEHCVTSVAPTAAWRRSRREPMSGIPTARQPGRPAAPSARPGSFRLLSGHRSWRPWSTPFRPATTGCTNINMTATGC